MNQNRILETFTIDWQGFTLSVEYNPAYFGDKSGYVIAHYDIHVVSPNRAAIPITETGYRSHFLPPSEVDALGGAKPYLLAWLDHEAKSPEWRKLHAVGQQLDLF